MKQKLTPIELARQTLIKLSKDQTPATPENYRRVYDEIAGVKSIDNAAILHTAFERVLRDMGKMRPQYAASAQRIANLIDKQDAPALEKQLQDLFHQTSHESTSVNWATLLRYLLKQLDTNHSGLTLSHKKEGLNRVIANFGSDPEQLGHKIQSLVASWGDRPAGEAVLSAELTNTGTPATAASSNTESAQKALAATWREMLIRTIELIIVPQFNETPSAKNRIEVLIVRANAANSLEEVTQIDGLLKATLLRAEMQNDSQQRIRQALIEILRLLVSSMSELTIEDAWLNGQIRIVQNIISKPLNIDSIYSAESNLKELIFKQSNIKPGLLAAKETLRNMVSTFVSRLADITVSTGSYQLKIQSYQEQISNTDDIAQLSTMLERLVEDIGAMSADAKQNHDALEETQKKVAEAEKQINELTVKLDYISEVAHEDFLTGALNRRGMDEALAREFERADRHNTPLSLAMLDIDHFKKINDTLGHSTGDKALAHLAKVVKNILRSTDVLARYGGEEFVILLPGSKQDDAINVTSNLQRELTKNFFLHNNERVLITFSAGVAERLPNEDIDSILPRADAALYLAKQSGRNRVIGAVLPSTLLTDGD